jgi:hypothetical protein
LTLGGRARYKEQPVSLSTGLRARRRRNGLLLAAAVLAGTVALAPMARGATSDTQKLYVTFELTQTFRVTLPDGTRVGQPSPPGTTIPPGTYELIFDNSTNVKNLNFQLTGPNVSLQEDMGGGEESSAGDYVTFLPSSQYSYHDGNNITSQTFYLQTAASGGSVGGNGTGLPGSNSTTAGSSSGNSSVIGSTGSKASSHSSAAPFRGTLQGLVSTSGTLSLTFGGRPVTSLRSGRYTVAVSDRSAKSGFTIQEIRQDATTVTGAPFVGARKAAITLKPGQWFFYATFVGKKTYFIVVS